MKDSCFKNVNLCFTGTSSTVTYTPITELDYGTLLCTASNKIGRQRVPCVFHIIAAGKNLIRHLYFRSNRNKKIYFQFYKKLEIRNSM